MHYKPHKTRSWWQLKCLRAEPPPVTQIPSVVDISLESVDIKAFRFIT